MLGVICDLADVKTKPEGIEVTKKTKKGVARRLRGRQQHRVWRRHSAGEVVQSEKTLASTQTVIEPEFIDHMRCDGSVNAHSRSLGPGFRVVEVAKSRP